MSVESLGSIVYHLAYCCKPPGLKSESSCVYCWCWSVKEVALWQLYHPRRPRGSQSGRQKWQDESFQVWVKEVLGTNSHGTIFKNSSGCRLLIGHKKCFVLLCPIGEQLLLGSFHEFVLTPIVLPHLPGSFTKPVHPRETFIFHFPNQKRQNYR